MTPEQIIKGMSEKNLQLSMKNDELSALSENKARSERDYKTEVRKQYLLHKSEGYSVTLIPKLVEGHDAVADLKFKFDVATEIYRACLESIKDVRIQIESYRSILTQLRAELLGG